MKSYPLPRNNGRRWKLTGTGLVVLGLIMVTALGVGHAAAEMDDEAAALRTEAYQSLIDGDRAASAGRTQEAIAAYSKARELYQTIQKKFPAVDPPVISYRIRYLNDRIIALSREEPAVEAVERERQAEAVSPESAEGAGSTPVQVRAVRPSDVVPAGR
ncbi:MAG: hypothetical protein DRP22_05525, partial [Verrucomicrobia bacterium]